MLPLFAAAIFAGAFLLFLVQPMVARLHLPGLGGSPAVWNTCMLFFQAALLAGYAYAHWAPRLLGPRRHAAVHAGLLLLPLVILWNWGAPPDPPADAPPALWLLRALAVTIGLPFLMVSTTAPLLQRWFALTGHRAARDPYFLYAASNAGSLIALLAYPAALEWATGLAAQRTIWAVGYVLLAALVGACAFVAFRRVGPGPGTDAAPSAGAADSLSWRTRLFWVAAAAVPSSLMLGVTQYISTDIAAVPLLWVVPLALYLVTFILAFAGRPVIWVHLLSRLVPMMAVGLAVCMILEAKHPIWVILLVHLLAFFGAALLCHARLAKSRPAPRHLTEFYLLIALGGVIGGAVNALAAPVVFDSIAEYPIALALACAFRRVRRSPGAARPAVARTYDLAVPLLIAAGALGSERLLEHAEPRGLVSPEISGLLTLLLVIALPPVTAYLTVKRPFRFALSVGALLFIAHVRSGPVGTVLATDRTFFGVYTLVRGAGLTSLLHGTTLHGQQFVDPERRAIPLTYYHPDGPIGQVFGTFGGTPLFDRVGLVGLGAGSLAAYGRPGQAMRFFEIDPAVGRIAQNPEFFTYLGDCRADYEIVYGDGRVSLRSRAAPAEFGLIVLDAFTSDAIPVHLITREAVELYMSRLRPGGLLAFHISNQYIDLRAVLARIAQSLSLVCVVRSDSVPGEETIRTGRSGSNWALLARSRADLGELANDSRWQELRPGPRAPLWTDDYSNIFTVFRWD